MGAAYVWTMAGLYGFWFPRIVARRRALEVEAHPRARLCWALKIGLMRLWMLVMGTVFIGWLWKVAVD